MKRFRDMTWLVAFALTASGNYLFSQIMGKERMIWFLSRREGDAWNKK